MIIFAEVRVTRKIFRTEYDMSGFKMRLCKLVYAVCSTTMETSLDITLTYATDIFHFFGAFFRQIFICKLNKKLFQ